MTPRPTSPRRPTARPRPPPRASGARSSTRPCSAGSVLLALTFAATHVSAISAAGGTSQSIIETALTSSAAKAVLIISTVGQLFCGMACVTSASRMTFAFSRDGAVPGHNLWRRLGKNRTPTWAVVFVTVVAADHHDPGLQGRHGRPAGGLPGRHLDLGDRPLHRLHDPDLPALADGRQVRGRAVDAGREVQVDQPDRDHLGGPVRDHLLPALHPGRGAVLQPVQLVGVQLRAAGHDRGDAGRDDLVPRCRPATRSRGRSARSTSRRAGATVPTGMAPAAPSDCSGAR